MVAGVAILAILALAQTPAGGRALARPPAPSSAAFTLPASNGFTIDVGSEAGVVTLVASERRPPFATFSPAGRPRPADTGNGASSLYFATAATGPSEIDARLGGLGAIAVSFRPSGETEVTVLRSRIVGGRCAPAIRIIRHLGTFTGTIRFHGEDGYTAVEATRAPGSVGTPLPPACPRARSARLGADLGAAALRAVNRRAGTSFEARTTPSGVSFRATLEERLEGGLVVVRRAFAGAPRSTFSFNRTLTWARVKPPAPFSGSARFDADGAGGTGAGRAGCAPPFPASTCR